MIVMEDRSLNLVLLETKLTWLRLTVKLARPGLDPVAEYVVMEMFPILRNTVFVLDTVA